MKRLRMAIPLALIILASGSCRENDGVIEGEGTVHLGVAPECPAIWRIDMTGGRMIWPIEDPAFQEEGVRVRFRARVKNEAVSICMAGTIVEIVSLQRF